MKAVVQRVKSASVTVGGEEVGTIGHGLLVFLGIGKSDDEQTMRWMANKIASLRIFPDDEGRMSLDVHAVGGEILVVSQFTLYGDCRKGNRPSFDGSAAPEKAREMYGRFLQIIETNAPGKVKSGRFQEMMDVKLVNDGPVTLLVEKEAKTV